MQLDQIPVYVDFVEVEVPPIVLALGAVCFVAILTGFVWLVLHLAGRIRRTTIDQQADLWVWVPGQFESRAGG